MRANGTDIITHPPQHTEMRSGMNITHKLMKPTVMLWGPFGDETRKVPDRSKEVGSAHTGAVKTLHEYPRGNWLKSSLFF